MTMSKPPAHHAVSATQFVREFSKWSQVARNQPVVIKRHNTPVLAVIAHEEWERLTVSDQETIRELQFLRALAEDYLPTSVNELDDARRVAKDHDRPAVHYLNAYNISTKIFYPEYHPPYA